MAAPTVTVPGTVLTAVTSGSHAATLPATINANDIIVLCYMAKNTSGTVATAITWPANFVDVFTQLNHFNATGTARGLVGVAWKRADGSEGGTNITVSHNGATGAATIFYGSCVIVVGCETSGNPFDQSVTNNPNNTNTIDWPSITTTGTEKTLLTGFQNSDNNANAATPTNWVEVLTGSNGSGSDAAIDLDKRENLSAGTYDPANATVANSNATGWVTWQIEFKPPAGGAAPSPFILNQARDYLG